MASILLAFGIEAWWDSRGDAVQARALVVALSQDFGTTRRRFDATRFAYETVLKSTERVLTYAEAGPIPESQWPQVDTVLSRLFYSMATFEPPMGAVETILSSGRLDLFREQDLMGELTRWTSTLEDLTLSPDGSRIVYRGATQLWQRPINQLQIEQIPGTEEARNPVLSPDGNSVAFTSQGSLCRTARPLV